MMSLHHLCDNSDMFVENIIARLLLKSVGISPGKAAVMQICGDASKCHVMHIIHSGIPLKLRSLLEDPTLIKVSWTQKLKSFRVHFINKLKNG